MKILTNLYNNIGDKVMETVAKQPHSHHPQIE